MQSRGERVLKAFLCDVGGVVVPWHPGRAERQLAALVGRENDMSFLTRAERLFQDEPWTGYGTGQLTTQEFIECLREELWLPGTLPDADIGRAVADVFDPPNQDVLAILHELRNRGIPTVAVTNIEPLRESWLGAKYDLWHQFEASVRSYKVKALKPDHRMYEAAHQMVTLKAGSCQVVFADDTLLNVEAAEQFGVVSHHFTTAEGLRSFLTKCGYLSQYPRDVQFSAW